MAKYSIEINEAYNDEMQTILNYVKKNNLDLSKIIVDYLFELFENDFELDEERILKAYEKAKENQKNGKVHSHDEVMARYGL